MWMRSALAAIATITALLSALACGAPPARDPVQAWARQHGIEILGVQLLAGGDLAKLTYRVVDFKKARTAFRGEMHLLTEDGARPLGVISLARLGPMQQRPSAAGAQQFVLFRNTERLLRKGNTAVLTVGADRIAGIPIS